MAISIKDGPEYHYGNMGNMTAAIFGTPESDPNIEAGPDANFQGAGVLDMRYWFPKDQMGGYIGRFPVHLMMSQLRSVNQIPAAFGTATIAALANAASGVAMTLVTSNATGITLGVPVVPFNVGGISSGTVQTGIALDFGFAFGTVVSGNASITVANAYDFSVGMPLIIAGAGNAGGTIPLLTWVTAITDTTHITVFDLPLSSVNPAAIGTGNIWQPNEGQTSAANMRPTAALPYLAGGPGLFLDPRQTVARAVSITGVVSGTGGAFIVRGADIYNVLMSETITAGAGVSTVFGKKAFKYIFSVTPQFTDAHTYSVGTSDVFGIHYRTPTWEDLEASWNATYMSATLGYTAPLALITASTATTADVRGTIQTSAQGGGSGIGATASNGTVSGLAMSGVRLMIQQSVASNQALFAFPGSAGNVASAVNVPNAAALFGNGQFTS